MATSTDSAGIEAASPLRGWAEPRTTARAITGTAAVICLLAGTKTASYLGVAPLYATDVLIALAVATAAMTWGLGLQARTAQSRRGWPGVAATLFLGYVLLRFILGTNHSLVAVRDFAPYGYVIVAFLAAHGMHRSTPQGRARTMRFVRWALLAHLVWVSAVRVGPGLSAALPTINGLPAFNLRGSTDLALVGVTAALYLHSYFMQRIKRHLILAIGCLLLVVSLPARAALLGALAALLIVTVSYLTTATKGHRTRRTIIAASLPTMLALIAVALPTTTAGSQLLTGVGITTARSETDLSGLGTVEAREIAWERTIEYTESTSPTIGVGFGSDFLGAAGGRTPLGGNPSLRSPHNYLIGTYARLGIVGVLLLVLLIIAVARDAIRCRAAVGADPLLLFAVAYCAAVFTTAMFGVELESPFCAVPFFWCAGMLLSRPILLPDRVSPSPSATALQAAE